MNNTLRDYHLERAAFWQKLARNEHRHSCSKFQIERHRKYWQDQSAESSRRAMDHLQAAGVISNDD